MQDLSFIPEYRDDAVTGTNPSCATWTWARDELLGGHAAVALANWPSKFRSVRPGHGSCPQQDMLKLISETEAGQVPDQHVMNNDHLTSDDIADAWQNLLRWAGDLPAARHYAEQWQTADGDDTPLPALRLGEIDFLMHQYNNAAAEFGLATRRSLLVSYNNELGAAEPNSTGARH